MSPIPSSLQLDTPNREQTIACALPLLEPISHAVLARGILGRIECILLEQCCGAREIRPRQRVVGLRRTRPFSLRL